MPSRNGRRNGQVKSLRIAETEPPYLTTRELEVVEWIAEGKRNGEIAKIIECSPRTVQKHVQHILEKLHVETRTAICSWWYQQRLDGMPHSRDRSRKLRPAVRARKKSAR
jgi:DNA-binding CsgD family transcriptional regulator